MPLCKLHKKNHSSKSISQLQCSFVCLVLPNLLCQSFPSGRKTLLKLQLKCFMEGVSLPFFLVCFWFFPPEVRKNPILKLIIDLQSEVFSYIQLQLNHDQGQTAFLNLCLHVRMGNSVLFKATAQLKSVNAVFPYIVSKMPAECCQEVIHNIPWM